MKLETIKRKIKKLEKMFPMYYVPERHNLDDMICGVIEHGGRDIANEVCDNLANLILANPNAGEEAIMLANAVKRSLIINKDAYEIRLAQNDFYIKLLEICIRFIYIYSEKTAFHKFLNSLKYPLRLCLF